MVGALQPHARRVVAVGQEGNDVGVRVRLIIAGACLAAALVIPSALARSDSAAVATGYAALLPGGTQGAVAATATGPTERSSSVAGLRPAGGGSIGSVRVDVSATSSARSSSAQGTVQVSGVSLLEGRIAIGSLRMSARTEAGASAGDVGLTEGDVSGLFVDGRPVAAGPGTRVEVAGIGTLVFLEQMADGAGGARANGMRLEVTDPQAASVVGQPFVLGHLDLSASTPTISVAPDPFEGGATPTTSLPVISPPRVAPGTTPTAPASTAPSAPDGETTVTPDAATLTPAPALGLPRREAPEGIVASERGYVFPVAGEAGFTADYGAPRAVTGWHHGNDLFAPTGTPLLAVADGTLSKVGVNTLGGNRLWLTDDAGNEFYYAHMSAYAPAAVEGARVAAGQVIGFVGNTGQAITTPPHLHFEVHPGGGDSVDPYPYLVAWQRGSDIPRAYAQAAISTSPAPAVGAVLVDGTPEIDQAPPPADGLARPAT